MYQINIRTKTLYSTVNYYDFAEVQESYNQWRTEPSLIAIRVYEIDGLGFQEKDLTSSCELAFKDLKPL